MTKKCSKWKRDGKENDRDSKRYIQSAGSRSSAGTANCDELSSANRLSSSVRLLLKVAVPRTDSFPSEFPTSAAGRAATGRFTTLAYRWLNGESEVEMWHVCSGFTDCSSYIGYKYMEHWTLSVNYHQRYHVITWWCMEQSSYQHRSINLFAVFQETT